jgi:hypothetical protein
MLSPANCVVTSLLVAIYTCMVEGDNIGRDKKATHETKVFGDNVYKKF